MVRSSATIKRHAMKEHYFGRFTCEICTFRGDFAREVIEHMKQDHKDVGTGTTHISNQQNPLPSL